MRSQKIQLSLQDVSFGLFTDEDGQLHLNVNLNDWQCLEDAVRNAGVVCSIRRRKGGSGMNSPITNSKLFDHTKRLFDLVEEKEVTYAELILMAVDQFLGGSNPANKAYAKEDFEQHIAQCKRWKAGQFSSGDLVDIIPKLGLETPPVLNNSKSLGRVLASMVEHELLDVVTEGNAKVYRKHLTEETI